MYEYRDAPHWLPRMYSGVAADAFCLGRLKEPFILCALDLPLSMVLDTALLPWKTYEQVKYGNYRPRLVPEIHRAEELQREKDRAQLDAVCESVMKRADASSSDREYCEAYLKRKSQDAGVPPGEQL